MKNIMHRILKSILLNGRFFLIIAVIVALLSSIVMLIAGTVSFFWSLLKMPELITNTQVKSLHYVEVHIIGGIDAYLIATVLLVFAIGLYELFIFPLDKGNHSNSWPVKTLTVNSLEELKTKISKIIIMVLVVLFFKNAVVLPYDRALDLLYLGFGTLLVALALYIGHSGPQSLTRLVNPNQADDNQE